MKNAFYILFLITLILGFNKVTCAQEENLDSLIHYGKKTKNDSILAYSYDSAARNIKRSNLDSAYKLAKIGLGYAKKMNNHLYISDCYNTLGILDKDYGNYEESLKHQKLAFAHALKYKGNSDYQQLSALSSMGLVFWEQGNYSQALEIYYKNLLVAKKSNDSVQIARILTNMGSVYFDQGLNNKALEKYSEAYDLAVKLNHVFGQCLLLNNLGSVYYQQKDYENASKNYFASLKISKQIDDIEGVAVSYINIGALYFERKQYDSALVIHKKALAIREEMQQKDGISTALNEIGKDYCELGNLTLAVQYSEKSLKIAKEIEALDYIKSAHEALYKTYDKIGNQPKAYQHYKEFVVLRDSLNNDENRKKDYRNELDFEYQSKQYKDSIEQVKKDFIINQKLETEKIKTELQRKLTILFSVSFIIMILLSIFIYRGYRTKKFANIIIQQQKKEAEEQRDIIQVKNKEILDSIQYAKRIQNAILPPLKVVKEYLQESFILYKPKDIVAGDFYWMETINSGGLSVVSGESPSLNAHHSQLVLFAAADCTGHGVPGAMVSVVCNNGLNRSVREYGLTDPGEILNKTREIVIAEFEKSEDEVKDGMDIALCSLKLPSREGLGSVLKYAGANNPLWIIRDGEIIETKADKQPIGKFDELMPYTTHTFELQKGDSIYIFSDGYVDQFGGEKGKKFKAQALRDLLLSIQGESMEKQQLIINQTFENWKGNLEQIDDVCVIGVKI